MLNDEFNDLQTSLPSPNFINIFRMIENRKDKDEEYKALILYIINDPIEFLKFGSEILKVVINEKNDFIIHIIQLIFDKIIELIKKNSADYSYMALISLYLPKLCDHYSHLVTKYIIYTSIPICLSIKNSTNTSLHAYSNNISIEKSIPSNNSYIKSNRLRNLLKIPEPINENKSFEELKQQMRDEFKQQIKDMQELLNSFIKNSNTYHVNTK
ncbi:17254_t:CDS:2 [Rhizophagus irregularis]|nr:17254_t:CDS:2 [Rhizophagus irregularis]